jgi:hypothetical protein
VCFDRCLSLFERGESRVDALLDLLDVRSGTGSGFLQRQRWVVTEVHLDRVFASPSAKDPGLSQGASRLRASDHEAAVPDRQAPISSRFAFAKSTDGCIAQRSSDLSAGRSLFRNGDHTEDHMEVDVVVRRDTIFIHQLA